MPVTRSALKNVQGLRGLAVVMVVVYHVYIQDRDYGSSELFSSLFISGSLGVDLFFCISGFIMTYKYGSESNGVGGAARFLRDRIGRIYPPYWIVLLPLTIFYFFFPHMVNSDYGNKVSFVSSYFLLPNSIIPLLPVAWTLVFEVYFYFIFALLIAFLPGGKLPIALMAWAALLILLPLAPPTQGAVLDVMRSPFALEFLAGAAVALLVHRYSVKRPGLLFSLGVAGLLIGVLAHFAISPDAEYSAWSRTLLFTLPMAAILWGSIGLEIQGRMMPRILQKLGDASYSIYLVHLLVMLAVCKLLWRNSPGLGDNVGYAAVNLAGAIIAGFIYYHLVEKPLHIGYRRLTRGRRAGGSGSSLP